MNYELEENKISKEEFNKLNEEDLMFITNPGRMGDVGGSTFVIKKDNEYIMYRVDGWYSDEKDESIISLDDMFKKFPMWREAWFNCPDDNYHGKYKYIFMGFGNGLCVDNSIYEKYYPYLLEEVKRHEMYFEEEGDNYNSCLNFPSWIPALEKMLSEDN